MKIRQGFKPSIKNSITLSIAIAGLVFLFSCKHKSVPPTAVTPQKVSLTELLFGNGTNVFRNVSFGEDPKTVAASEKKAPDETDSNYLAYSMPLDTLHADSVNEEIDSLNFFKIAYNFDQQKLNEIDEDVFLANDSIASVMADRLADYFTDKYGQSASGSDEKVWSFKNKGKKMKVTLSDQSEEYDYGKLSLVFYCEDY